MTFTQLVRPGAPVVFGSFASSMSMQTGAPTFGTPEPSLVLYVVAQLARRLGVPFRSGGSLCASKLPDAQAAYESANTLQATVLGGVNFVLHAAGWLEGGLAIGYEKFILDDDQLGMMATFVRGVDLSENGQALDAIRENGPGQHFLGTAHTLANFENAFYRSTTADNASYEQWLEDGGLDAAQRQRDLEEPARRVRAATDRCRHRRRAARSSPGASPRCPTRSADDALRNRAVGRSGVRGAAAGRERAGRHQRRRARVDLPVSTVARLLGTLESLGAVVRIGDSGSYGIGAGIRALADTANTVEPLVARSSGAHRARRADGRDVGPVGDRGRRGRVPRSRRDRERGHPPRLDGRAPPAACRVVGTRPARRAAAGVRGRVSRPAPGAPPRVRP